MKKITILVSLVIFWGLHTPLFAQFSVSLTGGTGLSSIPERDFNAHVAILTSYAITDNLDLGLSAGFDQFFSVYSSGQQTKAMPFCLEARYMLQGGGIRPYAQLAFGAVRMDFHYYEHLLYPVDFFQFAPDQPILRQETSWQGLASIGVGALFPLTTTVSLDLGLKMTQVTGGGLTEKTYVYGRIPQGITGLYWNGDSWNYLAVVLGIRTAL